MTIHVLVEGPSERALLERWCPRLLHGHVGGIRVRVYPHQGKGKLPNDLAARPEPKHRGLLDLLPAKLRAFNESLEPDTDRVVVLVDADDEDVVALAERLEEVSRCCSPALDVKVCLAVEETEAFYLGDLKGIAKAFPGADLAIAKAYVPDSICGTWELFGQVVKDGGGNKVAWAETMGPVLTTTASASRSPSFRALVGALIAPMPAPPVAKKRRTYRHPPKDRTDPGKRR